MRQMLALLLALMPAAPAAAQYRVLPEVARVSVSAPGPVAAIGSAASLAPSLSASAVSPAPLAAGASFSPAAPSFAAPAALPALPAPAVPAAGYIGAPALAAPAAAAHAPSRGRAGRNPVYHSLKDLARLSSQPAPDAGARTFDGAAERAPGAESEPAGARPAIPAGVRAVEVEPVRSVADVDRLVPGIGNSAEMHDELRARLPGMIPFDLYVYRDARGGRFTGIDLSKRPENLEKVPELQAHEVSTIKKIMAYTPDLQVLVREEGATPDLVVAGVVAEMKSVHHGDVDVQLAHANAQLVSHARRHGLGLGAAVLDVRGASDAEPSRVEAGIAKVVAESHEIGFDRVYVFSGDRARTYSAGPGGVFRLSAETPFARAAAPAVPAAALNFVPQTLRGARLPDMDVVTREIQEPSRLLRARGIEATVTMYGSARIPSPEKAQKAYDALIAEVGRRPKSPEAKKRLAAAREALRMSKYYGIARELGALVAKEGAGKVAVVTGGGPGIMEAGNRGAFEAGGPSVGYNIKLPMEQGLNPYATPELEFTFENFSTRKMSLRHGAMGLVYFPGGFGTMDELFEVLTLMQTGKMARTPIVLMGEKAYWDKILNFDEFDHMGLISHADLSLFVYAENARQAWDAIRAAHAAESK
ncbi:MAG: TIGR00730 family Rossman fold protein [Elusimicrobia bacterium]|nr:TIGR00730 family Rossman fold protein [Elusimicrobiota bacterium]